MDGGYHLQHHSIHFVTYRLARATVICLAGLLANQTMEPTAMQILEKKSLDVKFDLSGTWYTPLENIGTGAYGVVCSAVDNRTGDKVAIKKVPNVLGAVTLTKRTLREVKILQQFHNHPNILRVMDILRASGDVYIVFDLMETDLHHIIHSKQLLTDRHIQYFLYQILRGLKYIHSAGVIHRDLKPSNLMVNGDCLLKIGDFGMARSVVVVPQQQKQQQAQQDPFMTQYVATRWYRAPEILFSMLEYSFEVDLWSVGCIAAEMMNRRQLFPGKDYMSQLKLIVCYLGAPPDTVMKGISSDLVKRIIVAAGKQQQQQPLPWSSILPKAGASAISFVASLLRLDPSERLSASEALAHSYLSDFYEPARDNEQDKAGLVVDLSVDVESLNAEQLKQAMLAEADKFRTRHYHDNASTSSSAGVQNMIGAPAEKPEAPEVIVISSSSSSSSATTEDVEMLSAKLRDTNIVQGDEKIEVGGSDTKEATLAAPIDPKQRLKEKLLQHQHISTSQQQQAVATTTGVVTAQKRYQEREEKRRKRAEKAAAAGGKGTAASAGHCSTTMTTTTMSEQDKNLLERWQKLSRANDTNKPPPEASAFGDLIVQILPPHHKHRRDDERQQNEDGNGSDNEDDKQLNSAELYKLWKEAASMEGVNPEELVVDKDWHMNSP